jgi:hypothetical protein
MPIYNAAGDPRNLGVHFPGLLHEIRITMPLEAA